jgi:hypothetical protein
MSDVGNGRWSTHKALRHTPHLALEQLKGTCLLQLLEQLAEVAETAPRDFQVLHGVYGRVITSSSGHRHTITGVGTVSRINDKAGGKDATSQQAASRPS